ncbi:MAG: hypothetical protein HN350_18135 [Phycisphaerales bacterium]|nr:hypothetical protein [Phycisphaerales bacterium]
MNNNAPQGGKSSTATDAKAHKPKPRRWLKRLLIALVILMVLVAMAPSVISSLWGPAIAQSLVNAEIKGRFAVKNVSISWLGDISLDGLEIFDPENRKVLATQQVTLKRNLLELIASWTNLNELEIRQPQLWLYQDEQGGVSLARALELRTPPDPDAPPFTPPPLRGYLKLIDGKGEIISLDGRRQKISFSGECELATLNDIKASFHAGADGVGELQGTLALADLAKNGPVDILTASGTVNVKNSAPIKLADVAAVLDEKNVGGTVMLNFDGKFTGEQFSGNMALGIVKFFAAQNVEEKTKPIEVTLSTKFAGSKAGIVGQFGLVAPEAGTMSVAFNYKHPRDGWNLDVDHIIKAVLEGQSIELPDFKIESDAKMDIARLAAAIPSLLNVRSDANIESLDLDISNVVLQGGKSPKFTGLLNIRQARAIVDGKVVRLAPTSAELAILTTPDNMLTINKADVNIGQGLVQLTAAGTTNNLTLNATARLAELKQQLGQIFDLKNLVLTGNVNIAGSIKKQAPPSVGAAGEAADRMKVALTASAESVSYRPSRTSPANALAIDSRAKWNADIVRHGDNISATGKLDLDKLMLQIAGKNIRQDAAAMTHDLTFNQKQSDLTVRAFQVSSEPLKIDMRGTASGLTGKAPQFKIAGSYIAAFEKMAPIVAQFRPDLESGVAELKGLSGDFSFTGGLEKFTSTLNSDGHIGKLTASLAYSGRANQPAFDIPKFMDALWAGKPLSLPNVTLNAGGQIKLPVIFAAARSVINQPDLAISGGQLNLTTLRFIGGAKPSAGAEISITGLAGTRAKKPFQFEPLGASLSALSDTNGALASAVAKLTLGPAGSITLNNKPTETSIQALLKLGPLGEQLACVMDLKGAKLSGEIQTNIQAARTKPGDTLAKIAATIKADQASFTPTNREPITLTGTGLWNGSVDYNQQVLAASGTASLQDMLMLIGKKQIREASVTLVHDLTLDTKKHSAKIAELKLNSQPATFSLAGTIDQYDKLAIANLSGAYAIAWPKLTPIIRQFAPDIPETLATLDKTTGDFQLADSAGRVKGKFSFHGPAGALKGQFAGVRPKEPIGLIVDRAITAVVHNKPLSLPELSANIDGHIMVPPIVEAAGLLAKMPKDLKLTSGRVDIRSFTIQGGAKPQLNADIIAKNIAGVRSGKNVTLDDVTILALAGGDKTGRLQISKVNFTTSFAKAAAAGNIGDFTLKADADLPKLKRQLGQFIDMPATLAGAINLTATIKKVGNSYDKLAIGLNASATDFQIVNQPPSGSYIKPPSLKPRTFTLVGSGQMDVKTETLSIAKMAANFKPALLAMNLSGTIKKQKAHWLLDLAGNYDGQWEQINGLLEELQPGITKTLALTGQTKGAFIAKGLTSNPTVTPTYRGVSGNTVLAWDKGIALGLPIGAGKLTPKLTEGQFVLPLTQFVASGGTVQIGATIDMRGKQPILRFPPRMQVMKDVQLTQEFSKEVLSRVNPIFASMGYVKGKISLQTSGIQLPLGDGLKTGGQGTGRMDLTEMQMRPSGLMSALLKTQGVPSEVDYEVIVSGLDFKIRNGGLEYDNFTMTFPKGMVIGFSGRVGFDDKVSMTAWTPVSTQLLNKLGVRGATAEYARILKDTRIGIPITGNRKTPKMDMSKVDVKPLIKKAIDALLREKLRERL